MPMNLLLRCTDVKQTKDFYSTILRFDISDTAEGTCTAVKEGGGLIFTEADLWNAVPALTGTIYFLLSDLDAYYSQIKQVADVRWPLQEMSYGTREFGIVDCNGYALAFADRKFVASAGTQTTRQPG